MTSPCPRVLHFRLSRITDRNFYEQVYLHPFVPLPWPLSMITTPLPALIGWPPVAILLNPCSGGSCISPVLIQRLDLLCSLGKSGVQLATANLHIPTDDGGYDSRLFFFFFGFLRPCLGYRFW